jgi:hypothetical protein
VAESWQSQNSDPRSDSILRACVQVAQSPTIARGRFASRSALISPGSLDFEVTLISCLVASLPNFVTASLADLLPLAALLCACCLTLSLARSLALLLLDAFLCWCSLPLDQALRL